MRQTAFPKTNGHMKNILRSGAWASLCVLYSMGHSIGMEIRCVRYIGLSCCKTQELVGTWDPGEEGNTV